MFNVMRKNKIAPHGLPERAISRGVFVQNCPFEHAFPDACLKKRREKPRSADEEAGDEFMRYFQWRMEFMLDLDNDLLRLAYARVIFADWDVQRPYQ